MVIYKFNPTTLKYESIPYIKNMFKYILGTILIFCLLGVTSHPSHPSVSEYEPLFLSVNINEFSEDKLVESIQKLNFRFPHIVLAQAKHESGHFKSSIFKESNNMFGMKEAKIRLNLAAGTQYGHAYYDKWEDSLLDYALYYSTYLHKCKTEEQYFDLLSQSYAEDPEYVTLLKRMIKNENLKSKFE